MKLRTKVFFIFIAVALIPLFLLTAVAYGRYSQTTYEHMDEVSSNMFHNAIEELDTTLNTIRQTAGLFTFYADGDFSIIQNLKRFSDPGVSHDKYEIFKADQNIKFVCQNVLYSYNFIYGLYVFTPSGAVLSHNNGQNGDLTLDYRPEDADWYADTLALNGRLYVSASKHHDMFSGKKDSIFFAQSLYDVYTHEFLGVLVIDCDPGLFHLDNVNTLPEITLFTLENTDNGCTLYSNRSSLSADFSKARCITLKDRLSLDNLVLTATINYDALFSEFNVTGILLLLCAGACTAGILILSWLLSCSLTEPIAHLSRKMARQDGSHLTLSGRYLNRSDEIGTLYNEYNAMIEELDASIKKDYKDKLISLDAQMKSLEARINSHFLFNTLESINSIAEIEDNERIATMALALGNMFRYSIKTQSELVTIEEELNHVRDYVSIQQIRFAGKFRLTIDMPEPMYSFRVLKLILQPLVENSLYHGLNYCTMGDTISIIGKTEDSYIYLNVNDNGTGMEPGQLAELMGKLHSGSSFTELGHRNKQSIGLKNIQTRIELYYGKGYGLTIESEKGSHTCIQIKIPQLSP